MKPWYQSKTLLIAVISMTMAGLEAYQKGATVPAIGMAVLGVALFFVRLTTDKKLTK